MISVLTLLCVIFTLGCQICVNIFLITRRYKYVIIILTRSLKLIGITLLVLTIYVLINQRDLFLFLLLVWCTYLVWRIIANYIIKYVSSKF